MIVLQDTLDFSTRVAESCPTYKLFWCIICGRKRHGYETGSDVCKVQVHPKQSGLEPFLFLTAQFSEPMTL